MHTSQPMQSVRPLHHLRRLLTPPVWGNQPAGRCSHSQASAVPSLAQPVQHSHHLKEPATPTDFSFPHSQHLDFDGRQLHCSEVISMLEPFLTPERIAKIDRLVSSRRYGVVPLLENTYDMGNLAAVCRSADALGFGAVHYILRSDEKYKQSARSSAGADKWLDVRLWNSTTEAIQAVKAAGYQLVVTHLSKSSVTLQEVDFTKPTALVMGNEKFGATEEVVAAADHCAIIPMSGMVESLNISVAAAVCMYEAQQQWARKGLSGDLGQDQRQALKAALMLRCVRQADTLMGELLARPPPNWQQGRVKHFLKARELQGL